MQKDVDKEIHNYVDVKILAQVNRTRNPSENKIREEKYEDPDSNLFYCTFPTYEASKLLGVDKHICMITVLEDPGVVFFNNGFSNGNEKKALWSGQKRKKLPNPFSCTASSFMKRPIKENAIIATTVVIFIALHLSCVIALTRLICTIRSLLFLLFK